MNTKKLKQLVLDLAIHGKLVPQDPNDEPASELLARIKEEKSKTAKGKKTAISSEEIDEVPFDVPTGWVWCRLDELCEIKGGKRIPKGMSFSDVPTNHIYIRVTNMKNHTIIDSELKYIDDDVYSIIKNYTISSEDLYLTIAGTIGDVGSVPEKYNGMNLTENAAKLTSILCDKEYLKISLLSTSVQDHFSSKFHQVAQPKLSIETASSALIPLPPLAEQHRIVAAIEKWFAVIDQLESNEGDLKKSIEQTKKKVLDLAIHGKLVKQDERDEPASESIKRINPKAEILFENEEYGEVPNGWCLTQLLNISTIARGGSPRPIKQYLTTDNDGINWIKIGDASGNGKYIENTAEKITKEGANRSRFVKEGDFLLTNSMSFGKPYILKTSGCIHDGWLVISPKDNTYDKEFLYLLLSSSYAYNQFSDKASGAVVSNLNKDKVAESIFPLPPLSEQKRIVAKVEEVFGELERIGEMLG